MIRCQWLAVPTLLIALFLTKGVAETPVSTPSAPPALPSAVDPPSDLYARAFLANHMADELAAEGQLKEATHKYRQAKGCFEELQSKYPDWRADMVQFRLRWNNEALEEILARAKPAVETEVASIPRALPAPEAATPLPAPPGAEMVAPTPIDTPEAAIPRALPVPLPNEGKGRKKLTVLILADSMAIGGFGEKLDASFRADPAVGDVYTYIACGTNPLSWMKRPPFTHATTRCGYWSLLSVSDRSKPDELKDVYGSPSGHRPGTHTVPKIEDLLARYQPDILVMQNGNNFYSSFSDGKTIVPDTHGPMIHRHVAPLVDWLAENGSSIRKFYWISPPEAGNVTPEIQQFVYERIAEEVRGIGVMIDSRTFTSYPYKAQGADKEHFWGNECIAWGADSFTAIANDLAGSRLRDTPTLTERGPRPKAGTPIIATPAPERLSVRLKLKDRTPIPPPAAFAPYGEMLVGFLYRVVSVSAGAYAEKEILVFHPAYIHHAREDLSGYRVGKTYNLDLVPFSADSVWATVGQDDGVGSPEMMPYMLATDVARHPILAAKGCCD